MKCKYADNGWHECSPDCEFIDDTPLYESERKVSDRLLRSLDEKDDPTVVLMLRLSDIEEIQHGLLLVGEVLRNRWHSKYYDYGTEFHTKISNLQSLMANIHKAQESK